MEDISETMQNITKIFIVLRALWANKNYLYIRYKCWLRRKHLESRKKFNNFIKKLNCNILEIFNFFRNICQIFTNFKLFDSHWKSNGTSLKTKISPNNL